MLHIPVLIKEVIKYLAPQPGQNFIDCTLGAGGHAKAILEKTAPNGKLLGIDLDQDALDLAKKNLSAFKNRIILHQGNFADLEKIIEQYKFKPINGILLDLGMSSMQIESRPGFSFNRDEKLDMRFDSNARCTAEEIINKWPIKKLAEIFKNYADEPAYKQITKAIVKQRQEEPITSTRQLADLAVRVKLHCCFRGRKTHLYPATRIFQALRIAVNDEINNLIKVLPQALTVLGKNARLAVISFHSGEDRIVKNFFKFSDNLKILTKKPIMPSIKEIKNNPRSRSAKLRVVKKKHEIHA